MSIVFIALSVCSLTSVDGAERQSHQSVIVPVLDKLLADLLSSLDRLTLGSDTADGDGVFVHIAVGGAAVAVGDLPAVSAHLGGVVGGTVDGVSSLLRLGQLIREDPARLFSQL